MESEMILISLVLFIHTVAIVIMITALLRHSKSIEASRVEDMRLRADLNKFAQGISLSTPRAKIRPFIKKEPRPELDFSIFDLGEDEL